MSEDVRERAGTPADRAPKLTTTAAYGLTAVLGIATAHWAMKCAAAHQFVTPDDALLEMWIGVILPTVHLIGKIINHHLTKLAGDEE